MRSASTSELPFTAVSSLRAHLELMRPANMVTAAADVLAGFAVAGLSGGEKLLWLIASGVLIYGGGVTLNDFFDRRVDYAERPERPIPSGRVSAPNACVMGIALLLLGSALAFLASMASGVVALLLGLLAVTYDIAFKHIPIAGPLVMGSCRGLDLLLGVSASTDALFERPYVAAIPLAYIAGVTLLSSGEVHGGNRPQVCFSAAMGVAALAGVIIIASPYPARIGAAGLVLGLLTWRTAPAFYRAYMKPGAAEIRAAVKTGVLCLVFLDASIAAAYQGLWYALGIVALAFLPWGLARFFPVT